jgi:hypothetical protein
LLEQSGASDVDDTVTRDQLPDDEAYALAADALRGNLHGR